ncbi:MAG: S-methyl-5'-thioadenosine phosphorylase [Candidatus Helarchaeota archaeon]
MSLRKDETAEIGIIGGTGVYDPELLEDPKEIKVYTPYGSTSDLITVGVFKGRKIAFIPRHGKGHKIPPHMVPSRANLWALKEIGVSRVIGPGAVGSLRLGFDKGDFVITDQFIDRTRKRLDTFYNGGQVCHMDVASPFCPELAQLFYEDAKKIGIKVHKGGTYVCIEGPRFSTRAESKMFRQWGGDIIGMTVYPEVVLARELEMCYCSIATITDYDVWAGECSNCGVVEYTEKCPKCGGSVKRYGVSIEEILAVMSKNAENLKKLLEVSIPKIPADRACPCKDLLKTALI